MSNAALNWAFGLNLKSGVKFILVALADYADEANSCYPSYEKLEQKTGIKKRTIVDHLANLERYGLVNRERQRYDDGNLGGYRFKLCLAIDNGDFEGTEIAVKNNASRGQKVDHTQNQRVITSGAKSRKTTRKIAQNHTQNLHHNIPQTNHQDNHQGENGVLSEEEDWFERLWESINPKLLKSRRNDKTGARKVFIRQAKELGLQHLNRAVRNFYNDPKINKNKYEFAPAIKVCLNGRKYEGYLDFLENTGGDDYLKNRMEAHKRDMARVEK